MFKMYFLFLMAFSLSVLQAQEVSSEEMISTLESLNKRSIDPQAECDLGKKFYEDRDYQTAYNHFRKAAEQGNAEAQFYLGRMYDDYKIKGGYERKVNAHKWYKLAAEQGHAFAMHRLALLYKKGRGVEQNYKEAIKWYQRAAEQGFQASMKVLARMYEDGEGVQQNESEAFKWYLKAAEETVKQKINDQALLKKVAEMYEQGKGVRQNKKKALKWYKRVADQGDLDVILKLADMYENGGEGVQQNEREAFKWYLRAAKKENHKKGNHKGKFEVAERYAKGQGVKQDENEAFRWYESVAKARFSFSPTIFREAKLEVAERYEQGKGVSRSSFMAYVWFLRAQQGLTDNSLIKIKIRRKLESLENSLTSEEIAMAKKTSEDS